MQHLKVNDKVQVKQTSRTGTVVGVGINKEYIEIYYDDSADYQWYHIDKLELIPNKQFKFKLGDKVQAKTDNYNGDKDNGTVTGINDAMFNITWYYGNNIKFDIVYYKHQDNSFELVTNSAKVEQPDKVSKQEDIAYIELKNLCLVYIDNKMYDEAKEIIDVLHKLNNSKLETLGLS